MNLPYFISKRIAQETAGSFSTTINRIAVISIGLGLAVLILACMVLYGFKDEIRKKIYSFSGHLIVTKYTLSTSYEDATVMLDEKLLTDLNNYPRTEAIQPYAMKAALLKTKEDVQGVVMKGVDENFDTLRFSKHLLRGTLPNFTQEKYTTEVAISNRIANYLQLDTGQQVLIYFVQNPPRFRRLQVTGIYETGLEEFDEKVILGDLDLIRRINNWPDSLAGGVEVFIENVEELEQAELELFNQLDSDLYVDKVTDRYAQIFEWLGLLNRNVLVLFVIILFVSGTSIISILLILIMERTQMIGILKSLGASDRAIRKIFILNGLNLLLRGLFWGNCIGLGVGLVQKYAKLIPLDQANYYMKHVPIVIDPWTILGINALVLILITLTLLIPVAIISRVKPIQAIRFD